MRELTVQERRNAIIEILHKDEMVKVGSLSESFGVSEVTIRADLAELEEQGLLSRTHGGAVGSLKTYYSMNLSQRSAANAAEKKRIAAKIAGLIDDDDTILMNSGTTTLYIMRAIESRNVTIVTNSIALALESRQKQNITTILLGGEVNAQYQFTYGTETLSRLRQYKTDKAILSVDGVSAANGYSIWYFQESEICREMFIRADRTIIAADYTKIGKTTFANIADVKMADCIVTNTGADSAEIAELRALGVKIDLI